MNREWWKDLFEVIGVIAIVASLIFVAQEIRTNTESNNIAIEQNYSSNWMTINAAIAENKDLAGVLEKGLAGEELDRAETRQFDQLVSMYLTQSFHMLRLYDLGLVTESEVRAAFRVVRRLAQKGRFREQIETVTLERNRELILDPNGFDKWLNLDQ